MPFKGDSALRIVRYRLNERSSTDQRESSVSEGSAKAASGKDNTLLAMYQTGLIKRTNLS